MFSQLQYSVLCTVLPYHSLFAFCDSSPAPPRPLETVRPDERSGAGEWRIADHSHRITALIFRIYVAPCMDSGYDIELPGKAYTVLW